ncbi:hypothetical protein BKK47_07550 [Rodentibacter mrazii]|uniref:Uncharacterized protein n=1 Tax=Rodentibacter mrazii TaxID=1908257 RepID=A0A1V3IFL0_9PAST|nr:hypothetical protein BKK47_07550 [Rodentibacter mrazii]
MINNKVSKAFSFSGNPQPKSFAVFLYLKFVISFLFPTIFVQKGNLKSMIGGARNTTPKGNNSARLNASFEPLITLTQN